MTSSSPTYTNENRDHGSFQLSRRRQVLSPSLRETMKNLHSYNNFDQPKRSRLISLYVISALSVLLGLLCLGAFVFTSIHWNINSNLERICRENQTQDSILCFIRSIISEARRTQWNRFILSSLLLTYASVFFHIIIETNRTNISGFLGLMTFHTVSIVVGIGVSLPIFYLPSYFYFYQLKHHTMKSPVSIDVVLIGLIYTMCIIVLPTYFICFLSSNELVLTIMSIVLLGSPIAFTFVLFPFRLTSGRIQRCWIVNSHRLILASQLLLFIFSTPIYFITFIAFIQHYSIHLFEQSYLINDPFNSINPMAIIWSIDYTFLLLALALFIIINEYMFHNPRSSIHVREIIGYFIFIITFFIAPCLVFPLYIAWREYQYLRLM